LDQGIKESNTSKEDIKKIKEKSKKKEDVLPQADSLVEGTDCLVQQELQP
jgi:hypothetical protein